ncbi:hypothetical protein D6D10_03964 [Aureobasidium pullulans]|uniref:Alpha-1,3-mannosyltransferase n=1 Tax=Aureobasidium pullulans TaxID=5580 RepID=A0A4S9EY11_AURPU|nr:hypothetical protein D6D10_03964 [Aureobasidium pullulans]
MRGLDQLDSMTGLLSPHLEKFDPESISNYVSSPSRCLKIVKGLVFTGCALFCYLLYTSVATHPEWNYVSSGLSTNTTNTTTSITTPTIPMKSTTDIKAEIIGSLHKTGKPLYYTIHTNQPYDIDLALRAVLHLSPDEVYNKALTQPIKSGGEEKLRELGLRVRMFKKYFDAWEALHVVTDGLSNTAFVRDDILRYIRDAKDISAFTAGTRLEAMHAYETYRTFLSSMSTILFPWTTPYFSDHMTLHGHMYNAGRGIVISGSNDQAPYIKTAISSFRAMGCTLPVEIMYLGDEDLSEDTRAELETIPDVITRDIEQMVNDQGWELKGWAGKAFAAFLSSFREVILLDADVLFFDNPELMFEESGYVDTGALFFRDRVVFPQDKKSFLRKILPKPVSGKARQSRWWSGESGEYQESGVVVVDKWRHFLSVFLTARLNGPDRDDSDAGKGTYSFWWGDKETWWIGFELAGDTDYHFHQGEAGNMGTVSNIEPIEKPKDKEEEKKEEEKTDEDLKLNVLDTAAIEQQPHKTDAEEFKDQLDSLTKLENGESQGSATETQNEETAGGEQEDAENPTEDNKEPSESTGAEGETEFIYPPTTHDDVLRAVEAAEAENATPQFKEPEHPVSAQNISTPTTDALAGKSEEELASPVSEPAVKSERSLSRRHLTKRDDWFDTALNAKHTNLTGPAMLNLTNQYAVLCSPQLLHLSLSGRPMWFNGWIQQNKHEAASKVSTFEFYMGEKKKDGEWAEWGIGADNMCCLKSDGLKAFDEKELNALKMIENIAYESGALDQVKKPEKDAENETGY